MPVTASFLPQDSKGLDKKIKENKPGEETQLCIDIRTHVSKRSKVLETFTNQKQLGLSGSSAYRQSPHGDVNLLVRAEKYTVYLIEGKFKVGGKEYYQEGYVYKVEDEKEIQLVKGTGVVIINQV